MTDEPDLIPGTALKCAGCDITFTLREDHAEQIPEGACIAAYLWGRDTHQCPRNAVKTDATRMSTCALCGETKVADPTSSYFTARPDRETDSDWDGCVQGMGT